LWKYFTAGEKPTLADLQTTFAVFSNGTSACSQALEIALLESRAMRWNPQVHHGVV